MKTNPLVVAALAFIAVLVSAEFAVVTERAGHAAQRLAARAHSPAAARLASAAAQALARVVPCAAKR